jgi:hypothetical protein
MIEAFFTEALNCFFCGSVQADHGKNSAYWRGEGRGHLDIIAH